MGYKLTEKVSLLTDYAVKDFNAQMLSIYVKLHTFFFSSWQIII